MVERIILGIAAVLVGILLIYAMVNRSPEVDGTTDSVVTEEGTIDTGVNASSYNMEPPSDEWFQENVVNQAGAVLVDFKAEWCGPCKMLHPHLVDFEQKYKDRVTLVQIDVDEKSDLARHYRVQAMPTVLLFKDGKVVSGFLGYRGLSEIEAILKPTIEDVDVSSNQIHRREFKNSESLVSQLMN